MVPLLKLLPFVTTMLGGFVALRVGRGLHLVYGLAAGAMLGLAAFHLLPEFGAFTGAALGGVPLPYLLVVVAFLAMFALEEIVGPHPSDADEGGEHRHPHVGLVGAAALVVHSFLDGVAIGIGFTISDAIGVAILIAVLAHDFADGMTTAAIMRRHGNPPGRTWALVLAGAIAPVVGAFVGGWLDLSESWVIGYAGFFAGTLIYFATRDMIPGARQGGGPRVAFATVAAGALLMWALAAAGV